MEFTVSSGGAVCGTLTAEREGLYWHIRAHCRAMPGVVRLHGCAPDGTRQPFGVLLPEDGASSGALITPIGYQPFMRCSAQHGYMLIARDERYDMLRDPLFDKFRFAHDEDFCRWIFEQMDGGAKIYPNEDAVDLAQYMDRIAATRQISRQTFALVTEDLHYTQPQAQELRRALQREGFTVLDGQREYIHAGKLQKINRRYTAEAARQKLGCRPVTRPMFTLTGDTPVEVQPDGTATLDI